MFCQKCGRFMDYNALLCRECEAANRQTANRGPYTNPNQGPFHQPYGAPVYPQGRMPEDPGNAMFGFGKALTSTLLGFFGFIMAYVAYFVALFNGDFPVWIFSLPMGIISLVFGIQSINCFKARWAPCARPVATLVLGIIGLILGAISLLFTFFAIVFFMMYA